MISQKSLRANLSFHLGEIEFKFNKRMVSPFGVVGLPWAGMDPKNALGEKVVVSVQLEEAPSQIIEIPSLLVSEKDQKHETLCLRFLFDSSRRQEFQKLLDGHGIIFSSHARKYPRVPASQEIQNFPLHVLLTHPKKLRRPIIFQVGNLSPKGAFLGSENPTAFLLEPGDTPHIEIEPRGTLLNEISLECDLKWIRNDFNDQSGNRVRYIGIEFRNASEMSRAAFSELIKSIASEMSS